MPPKPKDNNLNKIKDILSSTSSLLKNKGIEEALFEAELLLEAALKKDRAYLLSHLDEPISDKYYKIFSNLLKKRLQGWSLAVLFNSKSFYKTELFVNENVLVPRPETEVMVDNILKEIKDGDFIFDIGTGSGAIIISLALERKGCNNYFYASDKSLKALAVAKRNILQHKLDIKILPGDLLKPYFNTLKNKKPTKVIIAANLPYLNPEEMKEASIKKEPVQALLSGSDGLWHYKRLLFQLSSYLKINTVDTEFSIYCEINPEQKGGLSKLAKKYLPNSSIIFQNDLNGRVRFAVINIANHPNLQ